MILEYLIIIIKSIISLPFIFFIPGFLINSIYLPNNSLKFDSSLIFHIFVSIIITSFTALILAQSGFFSLFSLVSLLFLASVILYQKYKKLPDKPKFSSSIVFDRKNILIIFLIISAVLLFFHPFPWIAGGRDPGVYVSTGVHIAKTGSVIIKDPLLSQMKTSIQEIFYDVEPGAWANLKHQMPGFLVTDLSSGTITPQFLQIYPVWIAIFYSIFNLPGIFFVNPIFGLLSICSLYLIGKRLFSWKIGLLAGFILSLNYAQIWYVRYPFSEIMGQFFILSGLAFFIIFNEKSDKYIAVICALLFGLAFLTKIESLLLLFPIGLYYSYIIFYKKWSISHQYFIVTLILLIIYYFIDNIFISRTYVAGMINLLTGTVKFPPSESVIPIYKLLLINTNMISWYDTLSGIILAFMGICIILLKREKKEVLFIVSITLISSYFFLSSPLNSPDHPWWIRRFIPIIFPLYALFAGYTLNEIYGIKKYGHYLSYLLIMFLLASLAVTSYPIIIYSEGQGMIEGVSAISNYFGDNDVVLMGGSFESGELSTPLYYIYDRKIIYLFKFNPFPSLVTGRDMPSSDKISKGIDYLFDKGYNVYLVDSPDNIYMDKLIYSLGNNYKIDFVDTQKFSYKHLESTLDHLPQTKIDVQITSNIYRVSKTKKDFQENILIDIGSPMDIIYLDSGFYGLETWGEINNRWTSGNASVRIPTTGNNNLLISIYCGSFRPDNISHANFSIYINEHLLGNFSGYDEYKKYNMTAHLNYLTVPSSTIRIRSDTWKPSEITGTADTRDLGINIDKITIEQIPN